MADARLRAIAEGPFGDASDGDDPLRCQSGEESIEEREPELDLAPARGAVGERTSAWMGVERNRVPEHAAPLEIEVGENAMDDGRRGLGPAARFRR
jgi:hypothetical protein